MPLPELTWAPQSSDYPKLANSSSRVIIDPQRGVLCISFLITFFLLREKRQEVGDAAGKNLLPLPDTLRKLFFILVEVTAWETVLC